MVVNIKTKIQKVIIENKLNMKRNTLRQADLDKKINLALMFHPLKDTFQRHKEITYSDKSR